MKNTHSCFHKIKFLALNRPPAVNILSQFSFSLAFCESPRRLESMMPKSAVIWPRDPDEKMLNAKFSHISIVLKF